MTRIRRRTFCLGSATAAALYPLALKAQPQAPRVVASFSILADMARELAPAGVQVSALVGPDSDAHVYEPSPADARRLAQADRDDAADERERDGDAEVQDEPELGGDGECQLGQGRHVAS